jgi:hypothetical protein
MTSQRLSRARDFFTFQPAADRRWAMVALVVWCTAFIAVATYSIMMPGTEAKPRGHTVTTVYWKAARQWWHSEDMYGSKEATLEGLHGFLYFPQAAVLFTPFAFFPETVAEVLWRFVSIATAAWAMWRLCKIFGRDRPHLWFGVGSLLALPSLGMSFQNGQCNVILAAIMAHATVDMIQRRWWTAAILLSLGLALKPHVLVFILLLIVLQPSMRGRLLVSLVGAAAIALLNPDWTYVWQEHFEFVKKMRVASNPPAGTEQDLVTLVHTLGYTLPDKAWLVIRLAGAAAASLLALLATVRFERKASLLYVFTISILYIMIFNPRTEGVTHSMMGFSFALFAMQERTTRRGVLSWVLVAGCILLGTTHTFQRPTDRWTQPTMELLFAAYVAVQILWNRPVFKDLGEQTSQAKTIGKEEAVVAARG